MMRRSSGSSGPGLRRMRSGTANFPHVVNQTPATQMQPAGHPEVLTCPQSDRNILITGRNGLLCRDLSLRSVNR